METRNRKTGWFTRDCIVISNFSFYTPHTLDTEIEELWCLIIWIMYKKDCIIVFSNLGSLYRSQLLTLSVECSGAVILYSEIVYSIFRSSLNAEMLCVLTTPQDPCYWAATIKIADISKYVSATANTYILMMCRWIRKKPMRLSKFLCRMIHSDYKSRHS